MRRRLFISVTVRINFTLVWGDYEREVEVICATILRSLPVCTTLRNLGPLFKSVMCDSNIENFLKAGTLSSCAHQVDLNFARPILKIND